MISYKFLYLSEYSIVDYVPPKIGYSYGMVAGLGVGAFKNFNYNLDHKYYKKLENIFAAHNDFNQTPVHNRSLAYTKISWNNFVNRWWNKGYRPVGHYD